MARLKKLSLCNNKKQIFGNWSIIYPYKIKISKEDFLKLTTKSYNIKAFDNIITCYSTKKMVNEIKSKNIQASITNQYRTFFKNHIIKHLILILSIVIVFIIFSTSNKIIKDIKFASDVSDLRVYKYIDKNLERIGNIKYLNKDLNILSNNLRILFPSYSYIGVYKKSSVIYIDIEERIPPKEPYNRLYYSDMIAKKSGYVKYVFVDNGIKQVELNTFVKKGDILVKSEDKNGKSIASGRVLAETLSIEEVTINKHNISSSYTGQLKTGYNLFYNDTLIKPLKKYYDRQSIILKSVLSFDKIRVVKECYYEQKDIDIMYDYDSALEKAISKIYYDLSISRVSELEEIMNYELLKSSENDNAFCFIFLVKRVENIV